LTDKDKLENIFPCLTAKSNNKNFLGESNIKHPAYVDFRERMEPRIVINLNLGTRQSGLAKRL
jgi:hypothetical protein